nr:hypothetical protein [Sphingomonas sp. CDS-1]
MTSAECITTLSWSKIVAHVALNILINYVNTAIGTEVDFPLVDRLAT